MSRFQSAAYRLASHLLVKTRGSTSLIDPLDQRIQYRGLLVIAPERERFEGILLRAGRVRWLLRLIDSPVFGHPFNARHHAHRPTVSIGSCCAKTAGVARMKTVGWYVLVPRRRRDDTRLDAQRGQTSINTLPWYCPHALLVSVGLIRFGGHLPKGNTMSRLMADTPKRRPRRQLTEEFKSQRCAPLCSIRARGWRRGRRCRLTGTALREWVKRAEADRSQGRTGLTTAEREELAVLHKENRQLRLEREILKTPRFFASEPATRSR